MPELPEVEYGRKVAAAVGEGRTIARAQGSEDSIVFEGVSLRRFQRAVQGAKIQGVRRKGKYLWFELDRRPWPLVHFGMTGSFRVPDQTPLRLEADGQKTLEEDWPPRFMKFHWTFDDGGELVFVNKRRLGRVRLLEDPEHEGAVAKLGFDPLLELPKLAEFEAILGRRKGALKGVLLDQSFAAGVGNWIADEVLYQAKLDPKRKVPSLDRDEVRALRKTLGHIIQRAVKVDADKTRFPKSWLFHYRWGKEEGAKTPEGYAIEHVTVAGRTTAWVPEIQS